MTDKKVAIVTGGSSGIGKSVAELLAVRGCKVYEISRRASGADSIHHISVNVTDEQAITSAINGIAESEGGIDLLVTCAGMGVSGAVEFITERETRYQFDVNLHGTINAVRAVLPHMRKAGEGHIVCVSSAAGVFSIPFQTYYSASKAAINSFVCGLANEVRPFGIRISAVMPGDINTGFTDARNKSHAGDDIYGGRIGRSVSVMEKDERGGMSPESIARFIIRILDKKKPAPLYTPGASYKLLVFISRLMPNRFLYYLIGKLYIK